MKYELIGNNDYINVLDTIAKNRGVENIGEVLTAHENDSVCHHYSLLDNIEKAVHITHETIEKDDANILIVVDSDADGYTSSAIVYNYLKRLKPSLSLEYFVHGNKTSKVHGVFNEDVEDYIDLVIIPDAGTNSGDELEKIKERGIESIVLDHHPASSNKAMDYSIVVNNQTCDYPNKELSGAGIAYKYCQALDDHFGVDYADNYLDLVAIGMIADVMNTTEKETRYYMKKGMEQINNDFLKAIIEAQSYSMRGVVSFKTVSWNMAPLINATVRYGSLEERRNMFEAFIDNNEKTLDWKKRGVEEPIKQPIAEAMARICGNIKGRQDRARTKAVDSLKEKVESKGLQNNKILVVEATEELKGDKSSLTGLVAMILSDTYKMPTIVLRETKDKDGEVVYGGSGRNFDHSPIDSLLDVLKETEKFDFVQGHDNAFGHQIQEKRIPEMLDKANSMLADIEFEPSYTVDFEFTPNQLDKAFFNVMSSLKEEWGHGLEEPYIVVKDIVVSQSDIQVIGQHKNTIKFTSGGVEFIKFFAKDEIDEIKNAGSTLNMTVVGRADVNEFRGNKTPQVKISDWKINKANRIMF